MKKADSYVAVYFAVMGACILLLFLTGKIKAAFGMVPGVVIFAAIPYAIGKNRDDKDEHKKGD